MRKLPGRPSRSAARIAAILISPPGRTPLLLVCTYLPAGADNHSLARYQTTAEDIRDLINAHPNAVTIVGGDLQTSWGTHTRKGEILHSALPRFTCPTASLPPSFDPPSRLAASSIDHFLLGPTHHTAPGPQPSPSLTYSAFSNHQSVNLALYTHCLPNPLPNQPTSPPSKRKLLLPMPPAALPS